jgi:hypothetical protein
MLAQTRLSAMDAVVAEAGCDRTGGSRNLIHTATRIAIPALRSRFPDVPDLSLRTAAYMCLLKPRGGGPPPAILHHHLSLEVEWTLRATWLTSAKQEEMEAQTILAYGCGWGRSVRNVDRPAWDEPWSGAIDELLRPAVAHIRKVCRRLRADVHGFPMPSHDDLLTIANSCVGIFTGMRPTDASSYPHRQSIHNWHPLAGSLYGWLLRAIDGFGTVTPNLMVNKFRNGILYPIMKDEGLLLIARTAFRECPNCRTRTEYDTSSGCRACARASSGTPSFIVDSVRLIYPKIYTSITFRKCMTGKCGTYVRGRGTACPRCGGSLSPRQTHLRVQKHVIRDEPTSGDLWPGESMDEFIDDRADERILSYAAEGGE